MDNIKNDLFNSFNKYYNSLYKYGYISTDLTYKLLFYSFIEELIGGPYSNLITKDDYSYIIKSLYCIYGSSCMFPFPDNYDLFIISKGDNEEEGGGGGGYEPYYPMFIIDEYGTLLGFEKDGIPISLE